MKAAEDMVLQPLSSFGESYFLLGFLLKMSIYPMFMIMYDTNVMSTMNDQFSPSSIVSKVKANMTPPRPTLIL